MGIQDMKAMMERWREDWRYPTALLCIYGFFSMVKPVEPFFIPFMTGPDKNLTAEQVNNEILPVWTYSYLSALVPVFLLTDWLRYKPVMIFQAVMLFITTSLLLWTKTVAAMQATQFTYAMVTASEVAYFSYIYSVIDQSRYRRATSYCRSIQLVGYTVGSVLGQLLVSFDSQPYNTMLLLTLALIGIALRVSFLLPMPQHSMFFNRRQNTAAEGGNGDGTIDEPEPGATRGQEMDESGNETKEDGVKQQKQTGPKAEDCAESGGGRGCTQVLLQLWKDLCECYSSRHLLYWSVWWAMATCGYNQTINYVQVLWEHVQPSQNHSIYNGGVEAVSNLISAGAAYGIGFTEVRWEKWGELALGGFSGLGATALFLMTFIGNIWVCYTGYIVFKCLYMLLMTIATYQIANDLSLERYALVFGINNFGALALQTILTAVVVDSRGLGLDIIPQFTIYASYFSAIALMFLLRGLFTLWKTQKQQTQSLRPD